MSKVKGILRLLSAGESKRFISERMRSSRKTVDKYESVFSRHPLGYKELLKLSDKELMSIIAPPAEHAPTHDELYGLFPDMERELKKVGVTKLYLWEKYKEEYVDGVQYSQFCEHFRRYQKSQKLSYVMEHKAGDKLMVDFAGKKLFLTDPDTGEQQSVEFFVGILPCSQLTFGMAALSQQSPDFLMCLAQCLQYIGGVPSAIVTDNLKPAVNRASKFDPELNKSMIDFADHYQTVVLPTRAHKPKDKALVESAVNILYTRVYAPLHDRVFHTLEQLNKAIIELIDRHNGMLFQQKQISRIEQFIALEKDILNPLPAQPYVMRKYHKSKAHPNCHVMLSEDKHHYSVPYSYVGSELDISYCSKTVEIYCKFDRIATHERNRTPHGYTTNEAHLHPRHRYYGMWSEEFFVKQGQQIGVQTKMLITQIFAQCRHPEQAFKLCQGILGLSKKYGKLHMEQASTICLQYDYISCRKLEYILINLEKLKWAEASENPEPTIKHTNIRGKNYFF